MEVRLLGSVEVVGDDGSALPVRGARQLSIVALLALHRGAVVSPERLLDDVWGEDVPQGGVAAVQVQVSKLRRLLGSEAIATAAGGYQLDAGRAVVDVDRFEELARAGRAALQRGDPAEASRSFGQALDLWRGNALGGVGNPPFAVAARSRLEELRRSCIEDSFEAALALGRHHELVAELEAQTSQEPLRERLWGQLMIALYRSGRQADALRAYQSARSVLADELGVEPGEELRRIEQAVLAHDPALELRASEQPVAVATVAAPPAERRRTNLTMPATAFVGRAQERDAVENLLRGSRLVTLVGPGGAGKTRLATEIGRQRLDAHPDGVWLVELAGVRDEEQIPAVLQTVFGLREVEPASPRAELADRPERGRHGYGRVLEYLAGKDLLVVLDNCEHLVTASARLAEEIIRTCPSVTVLATSREGLGIDGESLWPVPPLRLEDSIVLFVERSRAAAPSFEASAEAMPVITEICRRLDGLPLAIELAAARVRAFPLPEILRRIDDRFRLLTGGSRTALPRQQTLRAVVDWSYELLEDDERTTFDRMSVFVEGFTLQAAEAVCGDERLDGVEIADILGRLVDKSLVQPIHTGLTARYQLLQTLSQYGRERLADSGEADVIRARHAHYFRRLAEEAEPNLRTRAQSDWMTLISAELPNIRAALDWAIGNGEAELAVIITSRLSWFWWLSGRPAEGTEWLDRALAAAGRVGLDERPPDGIEPMVYAEALIWSGFLRSFQGGTERGLIELETGTELARRAGRSDLVAVGTGAAAQEYATRGDLERAEELLDESDACFLAAGDEWGHGVIQLLRTYITVARGELGQARAELEAWLGAFRSSDFGWGLCFALSLLQEVERFSGDYAAAVRYADEALELTARHGYRTYHVLALTNRAELDLLRGDPAGARSAIDCALEEARELAVPWIEVAVRHAAALWDRRNGDLDGAEANLRRAVAVVESAELGHMAGFIHVALGYVAEMRGDAAGATRHHLAALEAARQSGMPRSVAQALDGLAGSLSLAGDAVGAARMWGAATRCRDEVRLPFPAEERVDVERALSRIRAVLDDDAFAAAVAEGAERALDDLVGSLTSAP